MFWYIGEGRSKGGQTRKERTARDRRVPGDREPGKADSKRAAWFRRVPRNRKPRGGRPEKSRLGLKATKRWVAKVVSVPRISHKSAEERTEEEGIDIDVSKFRTSS